jgi:hypothetical protein
MSDDEYDDDFSYVEESDEEDFDEFGNVIEKDNDNESESEDESENEGEDFFEEDNTKKKKKLIKQQISSNVMTKYEYDRIIGIISSMIDLENFKVNPLLFKLYSQENPGKMIDSNIDIAIFWLNNSKIIPFPIILKRYMLNGTVEYIKIKDLILPLENETNFSY